MVRMLAAEGSSVSCLSGLYFIFRCRWIRLWALATSRLVMVVAWITHLKLPQKQTEALYSQIL